MPIRIRRTIIIDSFNDNTIGQKLEDKRRKEEKKKINKIIVKTKSQVTQSNKF